MIPRFVLLFYFILLLSVLYLFLYFSDFVFVFFLQFEFIAIKKHNIKQINKKMYIAYFNQSNFCIELLGSRRSLKEIVFVITLQTQTANKRTNR